MQAYLFVHFREKTTPDGEQVYFGLSKDGFHWEEVRAMCHLLQTALQAEHSLEVTPHFRSRMASSTELF